MASHHLPHVVAIGASLYSGRYRLDKMNVTTDRKMREMVKLSYFNPAGVFASRKRKSAKRGSSDVLVLEEVPDDLTADASNVLLLLGTSSDPNRGVLSSAVDGAMVLLPNKMTDL